MQKTILVVDDDAQIREYLQKLLTTNNFDVFSAGDGSQALEMVEKVSPDLVVLDLGLPKVSGETVCVEIKKNHPTIQVIVLTAKSTSKEVIHGLHLGADDYMAKPFVPEELVARIQARLKPVVEGEKSSSTIASLTLRESFMVVAQRIVFIEVTFGLFVFMLGICISLINPYIQTINLLSFSAMFLMVLVVFNIIGIIFIILRWRAEYIQVAKDGITKHTGILQKKEEKYVCKFIESITLKRNFLAMMLGYGTLEIYDPSLKDKIYVLNIANPKKQQEKIEKIIPRQQSQPMPFLASQS